MRTLIRKVRRPWLDVLMLIAAGTILPMVVARQTRWWPVLGWWGAALYLAPLLIANAVAYLRVQRRHRRIVAYIRSREDAEAQPIAPASVQRVVDAYGDTWERDDVNRWELQLPISDPLKPPIKFSLPWGRLTKIYGPVQPL